MTDRSLDDYPNLSAVLDGRVSGQITEWPLIRRELLKLVDEHAAREWRIAKLEADHECSYCPHCNPCKYAEKIHDCEDAMRELAYKLSVGGYGRAVFNPKEFSEKIAFGIDKLTQPLVDRVAELEAANAELRDQQEELLAELAGLIALVGYDSLTLSARELMAKCMHQQAEQQDGRE